MQFGMLCMSYALCAMLATCQPCQHAPLLLTTLIGIRSTHTYKQVFVCHDNRSVTQASVMHTRLIEPFHAR